MHKHMAENIGNKYFSYFKEIKLIKFGEVMNKHITNASMWSRTLSKP